MEASITRESKVVRSPRVVQLEGLFDIPPTKKSTEKWVVDLPLHEKDWNIGLIVGPSGCGKTTILKEFFKDEISDDVDWSHGKALLDDFPKEMGIKDIVSLLNSVGFSSPPSWMRPYDVLSTGEKFRVGVARALARSKDLCVIDEFTSVVDRTVAQIGSHAVAKTVRRSGKKLIAASCHYDIEDWLQPDWIYKPHDKDFLWRSVQPRPKIHLEIVKVHHSAWELFKPFHYLTASHNKAAQCFVAHWKGVPVAFFSYLQFVNNKIKKTKRAHRVVCLPDYQGVGIGVKMAVHIAACLKALGWGYISTAAHPARNAFSSKNPDLKMIRSAKVSTRHAGTGTQAKNLGRMVTTFRYVGPAFEDREAARKLINGL